MKNRHRKCGGVLFFGRKSLLCGGVGLAAEADAKTGIVFMNFGK